MYQTEKHSNYQQNDFTNACPQAWQKLASGAISVP
jgi:hypothetical protein